MSLVRRCRLLVLLVSLFATAQAVGAEGQGPWDVVALGAKGDAATDNTAVFQAALDAAGRAGGGVVTVPSGRFRINGTLKIPAGVTLQGTFRVPPSVNDSFGQRPENKVEGTTLLAYAGRGSEEGTPFITLAGSNAALYGVVIDYPEWKLSVVPPVPYPPCIYSQDTVNVAVSECCLLNPYEGIKFFRCHRHLVRNVTGYPSKRGLFVDECTDIGHIENIHFWPFGVAYNQDDPYCKWINTQGVAFELARTDWHYVHNTFCFGYGVGYKFSEVKAGGTNGNFLGLGADSCRRAVLVEQAQTPGLLITNGEFVGRWGSSDSVGVEITDTADGKVSLVNCSFWGPLDQCIRMQSPTCQLTASACNFVHWDNHNRGAAAIQLNAGKAIVQGCTFLQDGLNVAVGPKARSALLTGNQAEGGFVVENQAGPRTIVSANEEDPFSLMPGARLSYQVVVGAAGDGRFLRGYYGHEKWGQGDAARPSRWSEAISSWTLPVEPGKAYTLTVDLDIPAPARGPETGVYLDGQRLAELPAEGKPLVVTLPPSANERVVVELRCQAWKPKDHHPGSTDDRLLGAVVRGLTMQADGADPRRFNGNTGEWLER